MINVNKTDRLVFDLEMYQVDYNEQKIQSLRKEIASKYGVPVRNVEVNFKPITIKDDGTKISLAEDIISNVQSPKFQLELFKEMIKLREIEDVSFDDIEAIDTQVNSFVDFDSYSKYRSYKFKYVKWDNYLSYGKGNYFDFTKLNGLVLLNGYPENQSGKTTFAIDLLRFALFGKAQKSPTLDSVFNAYLPEATDVTVEAGLEIDGVDYVIRRTVTRPALKKRTAKSKCKQTIEYYRIVGDNLELIENCEAESATQTNNLIRDAVGSVDDFNLVISATSFSLGELLRMGQSDKSKLFSRWLGLLTIEKKEEIAKKLWKDNISPKLLSNSYDKATLTKETEDYNTLIEADNRYIGEAQQKMIQVNANIENYNKEKVIILTNRKEIKENLIKTDIATIENSISMLNSELEAKRGQMKVLKDQYMMVKDAAFDEEQYAERQKALESERQNVVDLNMKNTELKTLIGTLRKDNERISQLIEKKTCPTCGHEIDLMEQNGFIDANKQKENGYIEKGKENKALIDSITEKIGNIGEEIKKMEEQREALNTKQKLELKMTAIKTNIDNIKLQLENHARTKQEIEQNRENIKYNQEIDLKIQNIDISIANETKIKEQHIRDIQQYTNDINNCNAEIKKRSELIQKLTDEEKIIRNWTIYQQLVGKNGIVKIVLKRALPIINNEVARILNGLCDFTVDLTIDDSNKICLNMNRDGVRLDLGIAPSGFETVMTSLALRSALSSIGSISKPNFCVFDEILDGVGVTNYENVHEVFNRISNNHQFIIHITHNELIADWHTQTITVTKENNVSVLKVRK